MIKFFRHIRLRLLTQESAVVNTKEKSSVDKSVSKYLLYAIGEIVLVVIGILIALQINTWNNARMDNKRAQDYTQKLKVQLKGNIQTVDNGIIKIESWYNTTMRFLSIIGDSSKVDIDDKIDSLI